MYTLVCIPADRGSVCNNAVSASWWIPLIYGTVGQHDRLNVRTVALLPWWADIKNVLVTILRGAPPKSEAATTKRNIVD